MQILPAKPAAEARQTAGKPGSRAQQAKAAAAAAAAAAEQDSDGDIDEDDLIASTVPMEDSGSHPPGPQSTLFCSLSSRSQGVTRALHAIGSSAAHRLPRVLRREPLGRMRR